MDDGRKIVKVYLSPQQKRMLDKICARLGMKDSEMMRFAFLAYATSVSVVTDTIHS